ncbi:hypothetical protein AaE_009043 [Aphanomyces astaci]|uniref:Uncharacterized protein n=1 Tax=Aphanomyces astaci TaxID=112090 RepID=A0A6A5A4M2_APHAT|nr:hypothetical protein AaE_009043 [Aphanomyces astaci]
MADTLEIDEGCYSDEDFDEESLQDDADVKPLMSPSSKMVQTPATNYLLSIHRQFPIHVRSLWTLKESHRSKGKEIVTGSSPPRRGTDSGKLAVLTNPRSPRELSIDASAMPKVKQCFTSRSNFPQVMTKPSSPSTSPSKKLPPPPEKYSALHGGPIDPSSRVFMPVKGEAKHCTARRIILPIPDKRDTPPHDKKFKHIPKSISHTTLTNPRLPVQ